MREVKTIPKPLPRIVPRDPWLDKLLDGKVRKLTPESWQERYKSLRSAQSAIRQAAHHRGIRATVAIRGDDLYVQAFSNGNGKTPGTKPTDKGE